MAGLIVMSIDLDSRGIYPIILNSLSTLPLVDSAAVSSFFFESDLIFLDDPKSDYLMSDVKK